MSKRPYKVSKKPLENPCKDKDKQCGRCGIPNPVNTDTAQRTRHSIAILQSPKFQKSIIKQFGKTKGIEKLKCEFNRVSNIAKRDYSINIKKKFSLKIDV